MLLRVRVRVRMRMRMHVRNMHARARFELKEGGKMVHAFFAVFFMLTLLSGLSIRETAVVYELLACGMIKPGLAWTERNRRDEVRKNKKNNTL